MQVHVSGDAAIKERQTREHQPQVPPRQQRWLPDANFEVTARAAHSDTAGEQDYAQRLADAFRRLRNELAHGGVFLNPNPGWAFTAVRDLINQLFAAREV